ncbi:MAG: hypothetical protein EKK41_13050 [Hyphomicrobiales bacterium]|nr:MAG: hypothetical protein EKK41_13050 [Hyphomicrobiales bacterium]
MTKYFVVFATGLLVGAVGLLIFGKYVAISSLDDRRAQSLKQWSSEGIDWAEFSRFIDAGGRAGWRAEAILNSLQRGIEEEHLRAWLGPPDAVLIGREEIKSNFNLAGGQVLPPSDRMRPIDYIPYLNQQTAGLYIYKMGRVAYGISNIELTVMALEFSVSGKLLAWFDYPVSSSNPIGDYIHDTRTKRRVRSS